MLFNTEKRSAATRDYLVLQSKKYFRFHYRRIFVQFYKNPSFFFPSYYTRGTFL